MAMQKYQWVTGRCLWRDERVNGDEKMLSGDGEALKDDEKI